MYQKVFGRDSGTCGARGGHAKGVLFVPQIDSSDLNTIANVLKTSSIAEVSRTPLRLCHPFCRILKGKPQTYGMTPWTALRNNVLPRSEVLGYCLQLLGNGGYPLLSLDPLLQCIYGRTGKFPPIEVPASWKR
ncbi:unnamed protein product [Nezara viridula]|uniref:Uncharacterized protein n=1 Tax=Nezara viridula TaxID=85310 RepID=A0A9P0MUH3_NEZVI|nr:unnamed protein product [Nezara viridula]